MIVYKRMKFENENVLSDFLKKADQLFPIPLSEKQDINKLCEKLLALGTVIAAYSEEDIAGIVCGYANDDKEQKAYVSVLCVLPEYQGRSIAKGLIKEFIEHCLKENMKSIFLYTHKTNETAIRLYRKSGFVIVESDRDNDVKLHLQLRKEII